ncbi:AraC family transcriptional regulator [Prevotella sp. OH937_COT-195]|nr:AraC family transcriptional regulator [Prevotella sp. OH937_COT-195]
MKFWNEKKLRNDSRCFCHFLQTFQENALSLQCFSKKTLEESVLFMINTFFSILPLTISIGWLVAFTARYRKIYYAQRLLVLFFFLCSILYVAHAVYFNYQYSLFARIEAVYAFCTLAGYPLYYLYISNLTDEKPSAWHNFLVLLPSAILSVVAMFLYVLMDEETRCCFVIHEFYTHEPHGHDLSWVVKAQIYRVYVMKVLYVLQVIPACYFGYKKLKRFDEQIRNFYTDTDEKTLWPVRVLLVTLLIFACVSVTANFLGREFFIKEWWMICIPSILFSILLFSVGFVGYRQRFTAADYYKELREADERERQKGQGNKVKMNDDTKELLKAQIFDLMENQEIFRQQNFSLSDFVVRLGSNRSYVSNYINNELHLSFSDFINQYRVSHAQILMKDYGNSLTLSEIWKQSGFSSESSFYRIFKRMVGITPLAWKKQCKK